MNDQISTQMATAQEELERKPSPEVQQPESKEAFFQTKEDGVDVENPIPTVQ